MKLEVVKTKIDGCLQLFTKVFSDNRGHFIKSYHRDTFYTIGIKDQFVEEYYSVSRRNVLRGMHFQAPPADHVKIVNCMHGRAIDVVLDIRRESPTFGKYVSFDISEKSDFIVYIPKGCAHGFYAVEDDTILMYRVSSGYSPECDKGVLWNSFGFNWPSEAPICSSRDASFPMLSELPAFF